MHWPRAKLPDKGPKMEEIQDRPPDLKFSSEIDENFKRAAHQTHFLGGGGIQKVKIENFKLDWNFQARLKFSSEIEFCNLWALRVGNPLTISRGLSGRPGPKPRKSLKKTRGASGPRTPKSLEKLSNCSTGPAKISVSSKRCSPPKVFRAFLTHFWRNFDGFLTHFGHSSFPNKTRPILTHFWRISDAFWLLPTPFPKTPFGQVPRRFSSRLFPDSRGALGPEAPGDFFGLFRGYGPGQSERHLQMVNGFPRRRWWEEGFVCAFLLQCMSDAASLSREPLGIYSMDLFGIWDWKTVDFSELQWCPPPRKQKHEKSVKQGQFSEDISVRSSGRKL